MSDLFPIGQRRTLEEVLATHGPLPFYRPDGTLSELNAMQKEDIVRLAELVRALGDLPVGYGKTAILTCVALMLGARTNVILMPPVLVPQWVKWLNKLKGMGQVLAYSGGPAKRQALDIGAARWLVMSYGVFNNDIDRLLRLPGPRLIGVDEVQNIKGRGVLYKNVNKFAPYPEPFIGMSGTIMSKPDDGYAYVKMNTPTVYATHRVFRATHVLEYDFFDNPVKWHNLDLLEKNLDLARVRRTKAEVHAHLPQPVYVPLEYDLAPAHLQLYHRLMDEQLLEVADGKIDATTAGKLYTCSQQIIANWGYFSDDEKNVPQLFEMLEQVCDELGLGDPVLPGEERSKLIVWSKFRMTTRRLIAFMNKYLKPKGKYATAAYGEVDSARGLEEFKHDPDCVAGVFQPGSVGAGADGIQHVCWAQFWVEMPTTTIPFNQSVGRCDREGQRFQPTIWIAVARRTIQQTLLKNLFANDQLVVQAGGSKQSIKELIFPK
jgi:hypothetical protein